MTELFNPEQYRFTGHAIAVMSVGLGAAILGLFVLASERRSSLGVKFLLFAGSSSAWLVSFGMAAASLVESTAYQWLRLSQIAVIFIPASIFILTAALVGQELQMRRNVRMFVVLSLLYSAIHVTTTYHLAGVYRYPWGFYAKYGPLAPFFLVYFFSVMVVIFALLVRGYRRSTHGRTRKRMGGMVLAFIAGYVAAIDFVPALGVSLYPFGYLGVAAYIIIGAWVIVRYRLVDITPELAAGMVLETMHGAVIAVDADGMIRMANRAAHEYLGFRQTELVGRDLRSTVELPSDWIDINSLSDGRLHDREITWTGRTGRRIEVSLSASLIIDRDGIPVGAAYIANDITEQKHAEERLIRSSEELKQINREMQDFAYIVSHDLRAPLVSIKGFVREVEFAIREIEAIIDRHLPTATSDDRRRLEVILKRDLDQSLSFINSSVARMDAQITSILQLSRIGRRELYFERVDMQDVTRSILKSLAHQIEVRHVQVKLGQLPEITADRTAAEQIMGNLIDNALKYLDPGRTGELTITADQLDEENIFYVRDNGRGIAREDIPKVFDIFKRLGHSDVPGEGMGLAYVKALVRRHNGIIWCESKPGSGSVFSFSIPREHKTTGREGTG